jgi:hypothetical protein
MAIDRRKVKYDIKRLRRIKTWQLVLLLILSLYISATFLRINNVGMVERRKAVEAADKIGDAEALQERLYALQRYSSQHMNASTGNFDLKATYDRDVKLILDKAEAANRRSNNAIWNQAANECYAEFPGYWQGQIQCILDKQEDFPTNTPITEVETPDPSLYRHGFLSPVWSADFAGWSLVVSAVLFGIILIRIIALAVLKLLLHVRYRRI